MSWRSFLGGLPKATLMTLVKAYRLLLSPSLGSGCRFEPSCSAYALDALQQHGATAGSYLTLRRLARCHPWCDGGHDPVPDQLRSLFPFLPASALPGTHVGKFRLFNRLVTSVAVFLFKKKLS